jgi:hypothetical protein
VLVSPLPAVVAVAHHPPVVHHRHVLARPAASGVPAVPLAAGLATLLVAVLTGTVVVLVSRRARRAGNPAGR